ncbi:hypothetical protein Lser_V15G31054 [Lactuca serriola]
MPDAAHPNPRRRYSNVAFLRRLHLRVVLLPTAATNKK